MARNDKFQQGDENINWAGQSELCKAVLHWQLEKLLEVGVSIAPRTYATTARCPFMM